MVEIVNYIMIHEYENKIQFMNGDRIERIVVEIEERNSVLGTLSYVRITKAENEDEQEEIRHQYNTSSYYLTYTTIYRK